MSDAFTDEGALRCGAPGVGDGTPIEELEESGPCTMEYWEQCYNALFDVSQYMQYVKEGKEFDLFCSIEETLDIRRAFALAPEALIVAISVFGGTLKEEEEMAMARVRAITGPLPPVEEVSA